jgi:hypothetical protein
MTTVRLEAVEVDGERLPRVCMWCGAPADGYFVKEFRGIPFGAIVCFLTLAVIVGSWIGAMEGSELDFYRNSFMAPCWLVPTVLFFGGGGWLLYLLSVQSPGSRMTISAPLCAEHCSHWRVRRWWFVVGSFGLMQCALGGIYVARLVVPQFTRMELVPIFSTAALLGIVVLRHGVRHSGIHARKMTGAEIILGNVHPLFLVALAEKRDALRSEVRDELPAASADDARIRSQPPDAVRGGDRPE